MAFQQGSVPNLPTSSQDVAVLFDTPFTVAPAIVVPVVRNISADAVKYMIQAELVAKNENGFTVRLSVAPNTTNYALDWVAGDTETTFQLTSAAGLKITQLPVLESLPFEADRLLLTVMAPVPITYTIPWGLISDFVKQQGGTGITSPVSSNKVPQWGKTGFLAEDATSVTVYLPTAVVNEPHVTAALENQNADDPLAMIGGLVTNKLKDGNGLYDRFVYTFTAPIPTAHYKLVWQAVESS